MEVWVRATGKTEPGKAMDTNFYGNMGEPETPEEYKRKYGCYPPGYDKNGNKLPTQLDHLKNMPPDLRQKEIQKYREILMAKKNRNELRITHLTGDPEIDTLEQFDRWVEETFRD